MKALKQGWVLLVNFITDNNLDKGNVSRKLKVFPKEYKENLNTSSSRPIWAIKEDEAKSFFNVK